MQLDKNLRSSDKNEERLSDCNMDSLLSDVLELESSAKSGIESLFKYQEDFEANTQKQL